MQDFLNNLIVYLEVWNTMLKKFNNIILQIILIVLISFYPILFLYFNNVSEIDFSEVLVYLIIYAIISIFLWIIYVIVFKDLNKGTLAAVLFIIFITNYSLFESGIQIIFPYVKYWHFMPIGIAIILHFDYYIFKKIKNEFSKDLVFVLFIVTIGLLLINVVPAVPNIVKKVSVSKTENVENGDSTILSGQPNIYWMIFDECASFPVIEKYYDYHDTKEKDYLINSGFTVSDTSRNECGNTICILTNCLNLDYVVNTQMENYEMDPYRDNCRLYNILAEHGYSIRGIGDTEWLGGLQSETEKGNTDSKTVGGLGVRDLILEKTIIAPFIEHDESEYAKNIRLALEYFQNSNNIVSDASQFNLLYVCSPHQPFVFKRNGDPQATINYQNWEDKQYYLDQYIFIMSQIHNSVETIIKNDPNSIIVLSSDHGARFTPGMVYNDAINNLSAVYYQGKSFDVIDGKSLVNTLRIVLNQALGCDFEEVEVPYESQ